ncbi:hypothetical protein IFM89_014148 [Coptis chinensis]|uniref:Uncharacterized protein n=1 Tax=Coptis chinensis TaxID=261450 RepID=A0A835HVV1_9MAGN|nr:hypothetical protein IFM89_014148 [Coptis chinensis]
MQQLRDMAGLQAHFESIQRIVDSTTLPYAMYYLWNRVSDELDHSQLTDRLKLEKDTLTSLEKIEIWENLKILNFTRLAVSLWAMSVLTLYIRVQVNILGRHLYIDTARGMGASYLLLDESPKSRRVNDAYFNRMKDLTTHPQLAQRLKFMVRDVLNLGFPNRPGAGGIMPGMPRARKMPRMPGIDNNDNWEVQRSRSMPRGDLSAMQSVVRVQAPFTNKPTAVNSKLLTQGCGGVIIGRTSLLLQGSGAEKTNLLKKYFGIRILYEALQCVEELKARTECYGIPLGCCKLKEAFLVELDMNPHMVEPIMKLLEYLFTRMVLTGSDIGTGCLLYGFRWAFKDELNHEIKAF